MEKAKLVLLREKRALATPLELGSHESVTPVNTATKSADRESVRYVLTNMCHDKHSSFLVLLLCVCTFVCMQVCVSDGWMFSLGACIICILKVFFSYLWLFMLAEQIEVHCVLTWVCWSSVHMSTGAPTHRCGSPQGPPPQSLGRIGHCKICGGHPPSLCLSQGNTQSCPAQSLSVSCHLHL